MKKIWLLFAGVGLLLASGCADPFEPVEIDIATQPPLTGPQDPTSPEFSLDLPTAGPGQTTLDSAGPTPVLPPSQPPPDFCRHLLWPLGNGAHWQYQRTDLREEAVAQDTVSLNAALAGENAAVVTLESVTGQAADTLQCAPDGLYHVNSGAGLLGHPDMNTLVLSNPDGPFMPSADQLLPLGRQTSWDVEYGVGGYVVLPSTGSAERLSVTGGKAVLFALVQGLESVTIPGQPAPVNAVRINTSLFYDLQLTTESGSSVTLVGEAQSRMYWVEGVGLVSLIYDGGRLSGAFGQSPYGVTLDGGITLQLTDYTPPQ